MNQLEIDLARWLQERLSTALNDFVDRAETAGLSPKWTAVAVNLVLCEWYARAAALTIDASAQDLAEHFEERINHYRYLDSDHRLREETSRHS